MFSSENDLGKLVFIHIGKTGGSTLRSIIYRNYPKGKIRHFDGTKKDISGFLALSPEKRSQYLCLEGHMGFGLRSQFDESSKYLTFLRDPVDRVISLYYFIRANPDHYLYSRVEPLTLREFASSKITHMVRNCQTRTLAGEKGGQIRLEDKEKLCFDDLEKAKTRLEEDISVIGLTGSFDQSLMLCKEAFGWKNVFYVRRNTGSKPPPEEIGEGAIESLKDNNRLDLKLYEYAESLFKRQIEDYPKNMEEEVNNFRQKNSLLKPFLKAKRVPLALLKKVLEITDTKELAKKFLGG